MNGNIETGRLGEDMAAAFLQERGMRILATNYRAGRGGEIDIICGDDKTIVFVEVKTRNTVSFGGPLYSISPKKIKSIKYCANHFIYTTLGSGTKDITFRFDMISIEDGKITWHEDIFR